MYFQMTEKSILNDLIKKLHLSTVTSSNYIKKFLKGKLIKTEMLPLFDR